MNKPYIDLKGVRVHAPVHPSNQYMVYSYYLSHLAYKDNENVAKNKSTRRRVLLSVWNMFGNTFIVRL